MIIYYDYSKFCVTKIQSEKRKVMDCKIYTVLIFQILIHLIGTFSEE